MMSIMTVFIAMMEMNAFNIECVQMRALLAPIRTCAKKIVNDGDVAHSCDGFF